MCIASIGLIIHMEMMVLPMTKGIKPNIRAKDN